MSSVEAVFAGKQAVALETYRALAARVGAFGPFEAAAKTASIHLNRRSAFAGVHPRKAAILLVIRTAAPIESPRVRKLERVSAHRWHNELLLSAPAEVDDEVMGWLGEAYALSG
jgi:hypothetical protein